MFDLIKALNIVENRLAELHAHNDSNGYHMEAISTLELVVNDLNNELHAEMLIMDQYAQEFNEGVN
jgi:hypothetical protein